MLQRHINVASVARLAGFALTAAMALAPCAGRAAQTDVDAERISSAGHSLKWNWTPPGRSDRYGHAETLIHAPLSVVRDHVVDYSHYRDFEPNRFRTSHVVSHGADGSADVYIQVVVLHGMVKLWDVTRFAAPRAIGPREEVIEGRMVPGKGNVDDFEVVWTLSALDADWTVLKFDLMLKPGLPAPRWALDEALRDYALCAVDKIHDAAQGSSGIEPWKPSLSTPNPS